MSKSVVVTTRIPEELAVDLDRLATDRDRSRAWLIEKAIAGFVAEELALLDGLRTADAAIDAGEFTSHDDFMAELRAEIGARHAA